jgi:hypothetical protein
MAEQQRAQACAQWQAAEAVRRQQEAAQAQARQQEYSRQQQDLQQLPIILWKADR